jgi:hypothetical protein
MDWTNFAEYNSVSIIAQYIMDIDPDVKDIYDMLANVTVEKREEILGHSDMHLDKVRASAYYLGYIRRPNDLELIDAYGIELLPEDGARKIKPRTYHDAIACYKRGFVDIIKTMTLDNIIYGINQDDDRYILQLLEIRPNWIVHVHVIGDNTREILFLYPNLLEQWMTLSHIISSTEVMEIISRSGKIDEPWISGILAQYSDVSV